MVESGGESGCSTEIKSNWEKNIMFLFNLMFSDKKWHNLGGIVNMVEVILGRI